MKPPVDRIQGQINKNPQLRNTGITLGYILILSSHLHLRIQSGLFPSDFRTKIVYTFLFALVHATCPVHPTEADIRKLCFTKKAHTAQWRFH
jgi:hypothetical protein